MTHFDDPYDYMDVEAREHGYVHESELPNFNQIKDHLKGIVEAVYETGDVAMLESCLDEVCHQFEIKIKDKQPQIVKRRDMLLSWYLDTQNEYMNTLRH